MLEHSAEQALRAQGPLQDGAEGDPDILRVPEWPGMGESNDIQNESGSTPTSFLAYSLRDLNYRSRHRNACGNIQGNLSEWIPSGVARNTNLLGAREHPGTNRQLQDDTVQRYAPSGESSPHSYSSEN